MREFYIAYVEGYDEPIALRGPFGSYDEAVYAHFQAAVEAGGIEEDEGDAHAFYLHDDAVRIASVVREETS